MCQSCSLFSHLAQFDQLESVKQHTLFDQDAGHKHPLFSVAYLALSSCLPAVSVRISSNPENSRYVGEEFSAAASAFVRLPLDVDRNFLKKFSKQVAIGCLVVNDYCNIFVCI